MEIHILNGDAMIDRMQSAGFTGLIVMRECLIEGPVQAASLEDFWNIRTAFISEGIEADKKMYYDHVVTELKKLQQVYKDAVVNLWFGDDLFCQANMWFIIHYLHDLGLTNLYRVFPKILNGNRWGDYGGHTPADFKACYADRVALTADDITLAKKLWTAYATGNLAELKKLSLTISASFHDLEEVVQAHIDRFPQPGRPGKVLKEIMNFGITEFKDIFPAFNRKEGIYGFGDDQVKRILEEI
jgi:hypothetical protein